MNNLIGVIDYGETPSPLSRLLSWLGLAVRAVREPADAAGCGGLILPGAGSLEASLAAIRACGLVPVLEDWILTDRPLLALDTGLQMLFGGSGAEEPGLGILPGHIQPLDAPHIGWQPLHHVTSPLLDEGETVYFAHDSFVVPDDPSLCSGAAGTGPSLCASISHGKLHGLLFRPEKSGAAGSAALDRFAQLCAGEDLPARPADMPRPDSAVAADADRRTCVSIIPCLDIKDGRVVKGVNFVSLRDAGDPVEAAARYEAAGADELVFLDISATVEGRRSLYGLMSKVAEQISIPFAVGGGLRSLEDMREALAAGADKLSLGSAAVRSPGLIAEAARAFGRASIIVAVDVRRVEEGGWWEVVIAGGTERTGLDAVAWAQQAARLGAGEILLTSMDRDGARTGYDLDLLRAVTDAVAVPVVASGGAGKTGDFIDAVEIGGASSVLAASLFHFGEVAIPDLKTAMHEAGLPVRRV